VRYVLELTGSRGIDGQAGPFAGAFRQRLGPLGWLNGVLEVALVGGLIYAGVQVVRGETVARRRTFALLLIWFAVPILLQIRTSAPTQPHYFVMLYPVQYLLIAALGGRAWAWAQDLTKGTWGRVVGIGIRGAMLVLVIAAALWQTAVTAQLRAMMVAHPTTGGYGIPMRYSRRAARAARSLAQGGEIVVLSRETRPFLAETPTVFDALLFGAPHRFADPDRAMPVPQSDRIVYLAGPVDLDADLHAAARRLTVLPPAERAGAVEMQDGTGYALYRWVGEDRAALLADMTPLGAGVRFADGVVVAAYEIRREARSGVLEVWLAWWLQTDADKGADEHFTVQLLDENGAVAGQDDHAGYPSTYWQTGDVVLSRFVIPVPEDLRPGDYRLRAGIYHYPAIEVVPVVNPEGQPVDDAVTLQTLTFD
jgi:hypothetical protein